MLSPKLLLMAAVVVLLAGCEGAEVQESLVEHRYTVDVSQYSAPNKPASLLVANKSLALPLEARNLNLSLADPGSLQALYTRSFCEVGQFPTDLPNWELTDVLQAPPVHLQAVSVTIAFDGNDLLRKPNFAVRDSAGQWSSCAEPSQVAHNATTLTATLVADHPDATVVGIFPGTYAYLQNIRYTLEDSSSP